MTATHITRLRIYLASRGTTDPRPDDVAALLAAHEATLSALAQIAEAIADLKHQLEDMG